MKIIHNFSEDFELNQEYKNNVFYLDNPEDLEQMKMFKNNQEYIDIRELDKVDMIYYNAYMIIAIYDDVYAQFLEKI